VVLVDLQDVEDEQLRRIQPVPRERLILQRKVRVHSRGEVVRGDSHLGDELGKNPLLLAAAGCFNESERGRERERRRKGWCE
jgi:hypothetical protein